MLALLATMMLTVTTTGCDGRSAQFGARVSGSFWRQRCKGVPATRASRPGRVPAARASSAARDQTAGQSRGR
eukprot:2303150-Pyramimonas_sp.AAC.1